VIGGAGGSGGSAAIGGVGGSGGTGGPGISNIGGLSGGGGGGGGAHGAVLATTPGALGQLTGGAGGGGGNAGSTGGGGGAGGYGAAIIASGSFTSPAAITGGNGGSGGAGGNGGTGGSGGKGGDGGGGAGGTIKLVASALDAHNANVDVSGGVSNTNPGQNGRLILGANTDISDSLGGQPGSQNGVGAGSSSFTGTSNTSTVISGTNPFVANNLGNRTPNIADLAGGAGVYGLLGDGGNGTQADGVLPGSFNTVSALLQQLKNGANASDVAAVARFYLGDNQNGAADNYLGYDLVVFANLTSINLSDPQLGISTNAFFAQLLSASGVGTLNALNAGQVWATLVPHTATFEISAFIGGNFTSLSAANGDLVNVVGNAVTRNTNAFYISAQEPNLQGPAAITGLNAMVQSGGQIYAVDTAQNALVVINASDMSQRQVLKNGVADGHSPTITGMQAPSAIAVSADGLSVYVASATSNSIEVFARSAQGDLSYQQTIAGSVGNISALRVSSDNAYVLATGANGLDVLTRSTPTNPVLVITPIFQALPVGELRDAAQNALGSLNAVTPSGIGTDLYAVSGNTLYRLDGSVLASLESVVGSPFFSGPITGVPAVMQSLSGPANGLNGANALTVYSANGTDYIYVTGTTGSTISLFTNNGSGLTFVNTLQDGQDGVRGMAQPSGVSVTPDGRFVMVTGEAVNGVAVFARDAATGMLQFVQVLRNNVGGASGLDAPTAIISSNTIAYVASLGAPGTNGGLASFNIAVSVPPPVTLATTFDHIEALTVQTGAGNDTITLVAAPDPSVVTSTTINSGAGNDNVLLQALSPTTIVDLGAGDDSADVRTTTANATLTIKGGAGNDTIRLDQLGAGDNTTVFGEDGQDTVYVNGRNIPLSATTVLHGNDPTTFPGDTLLFDPSALDYTPIAPNQNAGTIQAVDNSNPANPVHFGLVTYDTFEAVSVIHPPVITLGTFSSTEGGGVTLTASVSSPGNPLSGPVQWDIQGNGSFGDVTGSTVTLTGQQLADFGLGEGGTYQIGVLATNAFGSAEAFTKLVIADVAPAVTVSGPNSVLVGTPYRVAFAASDPDHDPITQWTVNWGDGTTDTFGAGTQNATHVYTDPGTPSIVVGALDDELTSQVFSAPKQITVGVNPSQVSAGGPYTIAEGGTLSLAAIAVGNPVSYSWNLNGDGFGDATGQNATLTWAQLEALPNRPIQDNGAFNVVVRAAYANGLTVDSAAVILTVTNTPPTASLTNTGPVNEGSTATVTFVNPSDPSLADTKAGFTYSYDFNNSGTFQLVSSAPVATIPASFLSLPGTDTVRAVITDKDGGSTTLFTTITVNAVPPTLVVTGAPSVVEGTPYQLGLSSTDPGLPHDRDHRHRSLWHVHRVERRHRHQRDAADCKSRGDAEPRGRRHPAQRQCDRCQQRRHLRVERRLGRRLEQRL
jgi:hypothetical protein